MTMATRWHVIERYQIGTMGWVTVSRNKISDYTRPYRRLRDAMQYAESINKLTAIRRNVGWHEFTSQAYVSQCTHAWCK